MGLLSLLTILCTGVVIYVYIGYPLLLWLLTRFMRRPIRYAEIEPKLSLIIAAYNEMRFIAEKLDNSLALDYPADKLQIIVVTDGSSDETASIARQYEDRGVVVLHTVERAGKSAAINRGMGFATGDILIFSDANAFYEPNALRMLVRNFADPDVGMVSGSKTVRKGNSQIAESEGAYWKYESFIKKSESRLHSSMGVVGEMLALRRDLYTPIPVHIAVDDAYLAMLILRRGLRVIYEPAAVSWETPAFSIREEATRRRRINAGRHYLLFHPRELWPLQSPGLLFMLFSHKFSRLMLPFFMIGAFLANALLLLMPGVSPFFWLSFLGQCLVYGLAWVGMLAEKRQMKLRLPRLLYYIVSSNIAGLRGFFHYFSGADIGVWERVRRG